MKLYDILFAFLPGWFFIIKGYYFKGIVYFSGFFLAVYLILFEKMILPVPSYVFIILVWLISVIDSLVLYHEYKCYVEGERLIKIVVHNNTRLNGSLPSYFVKFCNAIKTINIKHHNFVKTIKRLSYYELPCDWKNFIHYYKNVYLPS